MIVRTVGRAAQAARTWRPPRAGAAFAGLVCAAVAASPAAGAGGDGHRASVVAEVASGRVLHARQANRPLAPASLTKLMTAYVVLEALERAELQPTGLWRVSAQAAAQPASRFGLREGERVDVATVLAALVVASANDAAVVAAEGLAGTEPRFVERMNAAARRLGMSRTLFRNASGLPADGQRTSARDMAVLARALWLRFADRASLFSRLEVEFAGRRQRTINRFLTSYRGADGMKTGFTCRAGFNLVASVKRDGRRLIGVVLGAPTPHERERVMQRLMDSALAQPAATAGLSLDMLPAAPDQGAKHALATGIVARSCLGAGPSTRAPSGWSIDVGIERDRRAAARTASRFIREWRASLGGGRVLIIPRFTGVSLYRALVTGLTRERARDTCLAFRKTGGDCVVMDTPVAEAQIAHARRVEKLNARLAGAAARDP